MDKKVINILEFLKYFKIFLVFCIIVLQPIIKETSFFSESKYEISDLAKDFEGESQEDTITDENIELYLPTIYNYTLINTFSLKTYLLNRNYKDYILEINSPPPQLS